MEREEILALNPIEEVFRRYGVELKPTSNGFFAACPWHEDGNPSLKLTPSNNTFLCFGCRAAGSSIDALARFEKVEPADILRRYKDAPTPAQAPKRAAPAKDPEPMKEVCRYSYTDENGKELYWVTRYHPKTFRPYHRGPDGKPVPGLTGVERVPYRLHELVRAVEVWVVEGEKDADNLAKLGFCATTCCSGSSSWLPSYADPMAGREVVICGDNDEAGEKFVNAVFDSCSGKVKTIRRVKVPQGKDVSDFIATFANAEDAINALRLLAAGSEAYVRGVRLPVYSMAEMEQSYIEYAKSLKNSQLNLGSWLPSLRRIVRGLVPGELVTFIADTGVGKTAVLQNLAMKCKPLPTIMFELELPKPLMFERFVAINSGMNCSLVEEGYSRGDVLGQEALSRIDWLWVCPEAKLTPEKIMSYINSAELKLGRRPVVVLIDYIGLINGVGKNRYERLSNVAEELKVIAKDTNTIIVISSQIHRKPQEEGEPEIFLHDAKDSGAIENSSGLVIGLWRDPKDPTLLKMKILKNTKGKSGAIIECNFNGENMRITERSQFRDVPPPEVRQPYSDQEPT